MPLQTLTCGLQILVRGPGPWVRRVAEVRGKWSDYCRLSRVWDGACRLSTRGLRGWDVSVGAVQAPSPPAHVLCSGGC